MEHGFKEYHSWMTLALFCLAYYQLGVLGAGLGYHRMLTHKSFTCQRWFECALVLLGLPAGTPVQWVGNHRAHHLYADTPRDPHSPHMRGFWWAHCGWYIGSDFWLWCFLYALAGPFRTLWDAWQRPRSNQQYNYLAPDIAQDHFFAWLSRPKIFALFCLAHVVVPAVFVNALWGWQGLLAWHITLAAVYNAGDAVDSFGHLYGKPLPNGRDQARNNWILAWLSGGDGWHANHHLHPARARHGAPGMGQWDTSWLVMKALQRIGVISRIHETSKIKVN